MVIGVLAGLANFLTRLAQMVKGARSVTLHIPVIRLLCGRHVIRRMLAFCQGIAQVRMPIPDVGILPNRDATGKEPEAQECDPYDVPSFHA
jgi:hypothetical protein